MSENAIYLEADKTYVRSVQAWPHGVIGNEYKAIKMQVWERCGVPFEVSKKYQFIIRHAVIRLWFHGYRAALSIIASKISLLSNVNR